MWDEGINVIRVEAGLDPDPSVTGGQVGHYNNMVSSSTKFLNCGFGFNDQNRVVMTQTFMTGGNKIVDGDWKVRACGDL